MVQFGWPYKIKKRWMQILNCSNPKWGAEMFIESRKCNRRCKVLSLMAGMSFFLVLSLTVHAADVKILSTIEYDGSIYIYIRGVSELGSDSAVQIGNVVCKKEQVTLASLDNQGVLLRTLILVDNSKSISDINHTDIQEILGGIVASAMENEQIKIGTFSDQVTYLCDYTNDKDILNNVISTVTYNDQDTYLSDILYDVIAELEAENACAYTRIVIVADGADDNPNGRTSDEVRSYIGESAYPVYAIGIPGKNNSPELETMFSFSRASKAEYFLLNENSTNEEIVTALAQDQNGVCLKILLDENLKDGSNKSILLKLGMPEGTIELKTSADMPFGSGLPVQQEEETLESNTDSEDEKTEDVLPVLGPEGEKEKETVKESGKFPWVPIIIAVAVFMIGGVVLICVLLKKRKKRGGMAFQKDTELSCSENRTENNNASADTVIEGVTQIDNASPLWSGHNTYLILKCLDDTNVMFKEPITDVLRIGRMSDQNIVIDDAKLSKSHCEIRLRGDLLYIKDCNSTNGTKYEGVPVYDHEKPIVNGGKIEIGAHRYRVELMKE